MDPNKKDQSGKPVSQPAYPSQPQGAYPPQQGAYPPQQGAYPPQHGAYPPQQGAYPPQQGAYPPQQGAYPPQQGAYPPQQGAYPPQQGAYPPQQGAYPPQQGPYPPQQGAYPPSQYSQPGYSGYTQSGYPPSQPGQIKALHKDFANFNANADAIALSKAFKGIGCDTIGVFSVLCRRSLKQRLEIAKAYDAAFKPNLVKRLKSELIGNFERFAVSLVLSPAQRDAYWVKMAIKGAGTDENALIDILTTRTNAEIAAMSSCYVTDFNKEMVKDISSDTSGNFKDILIELCSGKRDESKTVDTNIVSSQVMSLIGSTSGLRHSGSKTYTPMLTTISKEQIKLITSEFPKINSGKDIYSHIKSKFTRDYEKILLALIHTSEDIINFYVSKLKGGIKSSSETRIIRIIVSRCEVDLLTIIERYEQSTQTKFEDDLRKFMKDPMLSAILMFLNLK